MLLQLVINNRIQICWCSMGSGVSQVTLPISFSMYPCVATSTVFSTTDNKTPSSNGFNSGMYAISGIERTYISRVGTPDGLNLSSRRIIAIGY